MLDRVFKLHKNNTSAKVEFLAGLTTFLAMAYIIFVNSLILSEAGKVKQVKPAMWIIAALSLLFLTTEWLTDIVKQ